MGRRGDSGGGREVVVEAEVEVGDRVADEETRLDFENGLSIGGDLAPLLGAFEGFTFAVAGFALALAMVRLIAADAAVAFALTSAADFFTPSDAVVKEAPGDFVGGVLGVEVTQV